MGCPQKKQGQLFFLAHTPHLPMWQRERSGEAESVWVVGCKSVCVRGGKGVSTGDVFQKLVQ